ncbi:flagellar brake protein [Marinomonas epiphytica]
MAGVKQVDLSELDVPMGTAVQLEFISPPGRHMVKVLGGIPGSSLILSCPKVKGKNILVRESQLVNVRLMLSTQVCAFASKVAKSYLEPAAHLHIAYPEYVETSTVRQTVRVETYLVCNLEPNESENTIPDSNIGIVVDLSMGGARLVSKEDFGVVGDSMEIAFNLRIGDFNHVIKTNCEIKSQNIEMLEDLQSSLVESDFLNRMGADFFYVYGVSFSEIGKELVIPLTAYILETQRNRIR